MTTLARPLPDEQDDPREAILDMIEANLQRGIDMDLAPQLEARILRMFDGLQRREAVAAPADVSPPVAERRGFSDIERALRLKNLERFVASSRAAGRDAHLETIASEIDRLRGETQR